jgi:PII-like signaling protein
LTVDTGAKKMLVVLMDETDRWHDLSLYEAICRKLVQLNAPGATVQAGIMGYGANLHIHRKRLFGVSDDRPISVTVVDDETNLRQKIIPAIRPMVKEGLVFLVNVEVI